MTNSTNQGPIIVSSGGDAGAHISLPLDQLEAVKSMLREFQVPFWVDVHVVSVNGSPEYAFVNLERDLSEAETQRVLDAVSSGELAADLQDDA